MDLTLPLYTITGDTLAPGAEAHWHATNLRTEDGRPLFTFDGDTPGAPPNGASADYVPYTGSTVEGGELANTPGDPGPAVQQAPDTSQPESAPNPPTTSDVNPPVANSFDPAAGLPDGLTQNADGSITGTPTTVTDDPLAVLDQDASAILDTVPDNPSSNALPPDTANTSIDTAHGWDAGVTSLDTGLVARTALADEFRKAQADVHGVQDGYVTVPAHLREVHDAALAFGQAVAALIGSDTDEYQLSVDVNEQGSVVRVEASIGRQTPDA